MARFVLDIKVDSKEEFVSVMQELKTILPTRTAVCSLIDVSNTNQFNEDRKLNVLTDEQIDGFNRCCGIIN
jgi:hypothetical protein